MSSSKRYPEELKIEAVKQVIEKVIVWLKLPHVQVQLRIVCMPEFNVIILNKPKVQRNRQR